jgi:hypothetical protein
VPEEEEEEEKEEDEEGEDEEEEKEEEEKEEEEKEEEEEEKEEEVLYIVIAAHKFDCRLVMNGTHNKWQVWPCSDRDACFGRGYMFPPLPPTVVASVKGLHPSCEGQLHSVG